MKIGCSGGQVARLKVLIRRSRSVGHFSGALFGFVWCLRRAPAPPSRGDAAFIKPALSRRCAAIIVRRITSRYPGLRALLIRRLPGPNLLFRGRGCAPARLITRMESGLACGCGPQPPVHSFAAPPSFCPLARLLITARPRICLLIKLHGGLARRNIGFLYRYCRGCLLECCGSVWLALLRERGRVFAKSAW